MLTTHTLYAGIDVSSKANVVYLMSPNRNKHNNFSAGNSHKGSTQLAKNSFRINLTFSRPSSD